MTLDMQQVSRIQVEVMSGRAWEQRTDAVPGTDEAHQMWDKIAADIAQGEAKGWVADVPSELPI